MKPYLELHPISEKPPKDGTYILLNHNRELLFENIYNPTEFGKANGGWFLHNTQHVAYYLKPVTGVLVTEAELLKCIELLGNLLETSGMTGEYESEIRTLINSLTNKAK